MNKFYVMKEANTFSDTLECVGLASLLNKLSHQLTDDDYLDVHIEDKYGYFELITDFDFTEERLKNLAYFEIIPFIANKKDNLRELNHSFINYQLLHEQREKFFKLKPEEQKNSELTPLPNYDVIRQFANLGGYRTSFKNISELKDVFPDFIQILLTYYHNQV